MSPFFKFNSLKGKNTLN